MLIYWRNSNIIFLKICTWKNKVTSVPSPSEKIEQEIHSSQEMFANKAGKGNTLI